jgi:hypothetical protein
VPAARTKRNSLTATQVGDMNKSIIITAKDVSYPPFNLGNFARYCGFRHALTIATLEG